MLYKIILILIWNCEYAYMYVCTETLYSGHKKECFVNSPILTPILRVSMLICWILFNMLLDTPPITIYTNKYNISPNEQFNKHIFNIRILHFVVVVIRYARKSFIMGDPCRFAIYVQTSRCICEGRVIWCTRAKFT